MNNSKEILKKMEFMRSIVIEKIKEETDKLEDEDHFRAFLHLFIVKAYCYAKDNYLSEYHIIKYFDDIAKKRKYIWI